MKLDTDSDSDNGNSSVDLEDTIINESDGVKIVEEVAVEVEELAGGDVDMEEDVPVEAKNKCKFKAVGKHKVNTKTKEK